VEGIPSFFTPTLKWDLMINTHRFRNEEWCYDFTIASALETGLVSKLLSLYHAFMQ
jgi:hypothetical protein